MRERAILLSKNYMCARGQPAVPKGAGEEIQIFNLCFFVNTSHILQIKLRESGGSFESQKAKPTSVVK